MAAARRQPFSAVNHSSGSAHGLGLTHRSGSRDIGTHAQYIGDGYDHDHGNVDGSTSQSSKSKSSSPTKRKLNDRNRERDRDAEPKQCNLNVNVVTTSKLPQPTTRVFLKPKRPSDSSGLVSKQLISDNHRPSTNGKMRSRSAQQSSRVIRTFDTERNMSDLPRLKTSTTGNLSKGVRKNVTSSGSAVAARSSRVFAPRSPSSFLVPATQVSKPSTEAISPKHTARRKIPRSSTIASPIRAGMNLETRMYSDFTSSLIGEDKENVSPSIQIRTCSEDYPAESTPRSRSRSPRKIYKESAPTPLRLEHINTATQHMRKTFTVLDIPNTHTPQSPELGHGGDAIAPHPAHGQGEDTDTEMKEAEPLPPARLLPRRSSVQKVAVKRKKGDMSPAGESSKRKKAALPRLPTQVIKHTPKAVTSRHVNLLDAKSGSEVEPGSDDTPRQQKTSHQAFPSLRTQVFKRAPRRLSALKSELSGLSSSVSSLASALTALPTQILKHTPTSTPESTKLKQSVKESTASNSPCISKGRAKSIWTMADEIELVRAGGVLSSSCSLVPFQDAHVIALCLRRRNGAEGGEMANDVLVHTPRRSSSIPAQLHSCRRYSKLESFGDAIAHAPSPLALETHHEVNDLGCDQDNDQAKPSERYQWTVVSVRPREDEGRSDDGSACELQQQHQQHHHHHHHPYHQNGYGLPVQGGSTAKPSLMTRAQTYVRFKFLGSRPFSSKKLVGRGDSRI